MSAKPGRPSSATSSKLTRELSHLHTSGTGLPDASMPIA
jgi:hypothetical protein